MQKLAIFQWKFPNVSTRSKMASGILFNQFMKEEKKKTQMKRINEIKINVSAEEQTNEMIITLIKSCAINLRVTDLISLDTIAIAVLVAH